MSKSLGILWVEVYKYWDKVTRDHMPNYTHTLLSVSDSQDFRET